jgi:hypothetical protein
MLGTFAAFCALVAFGYAQLPGIGAGALLHPSKNRVRMATPQACWDEAFAGAGVTLTPSAPHVRPPASTCRCC